MDRQMGDLIPSKCITLRMAFDRFATWGGEAPIQFLHSLDLSNAPHPSIAERHRIGVQRATDTMLAEFRSAFVRGALEAIVLEPDKHTPCAVPSEAWREAFFSERAFLSDEIGAGQGGYFDNLVGRTPFIELEVFDIWLRVAIEERASSDSKCSQSARAITELIIGLANFGMASSGAVEEWAQKWGLPRLASEPRPERFNPMILSHWNLSMTISWMVWRDLDRVRMAQDNYHTECLEWQPCQYHLHAPNGEGFDVQGEGLATPSPITLLWLGILETGDAIGPGARSTVYDSRRDLWNKCGNGSLVASAINASGLVAIIPAHEWGRLELATDKYGCDYLVWSHDNLRTAYRGLKFSVEEILDLWPPEDICDLDGSDHPKEAPVGGGKLGATRDALKALYPDGAPTGLVRKMLLSKVNQHLTEQGNSKVEMSTLRRALRSL